MKKEIIIESINEKLNITIKNFNDFEIIGISEHLKNITLQKKIKEVIINDKNKK